MIRTSATTAFIGFPCLVQHRACLSEEPCLFLQVTLSPLRQTLEVCATCAQQVLKVLIRQEVLTGAHGGQKTVRLTSTVHSPLLQQDTHKLVTVLNISLLISHPWSDLQIMRWGRLVQQQIAVLQSFTARLHEMLQHAIQKLFRCQTAVKELY